MRIEALDLIASDDVGTIAFDDTATRTLGELVADKEQAHALLTAAGLQEVFSGVRVKEGQIAVEVRMDEATPTPPNLRTIAAIKMLLDDGNLAGYTLTARSGPLAVDESVYGGDKIRKGSGPNFCTTAFTVVKNGAEGVLTAGHCGNLAQYVAVGNGSNTVYRVYLQNDHEGAWGDMAWYTTLGSEQPWFYKTASGRYEVNGYVTRSAIQVDDTYCLYGRATNHSGGSNACGSVVDRWAQWTINGITYNRLVEVDGVTSTDGDSGGPWYTGSLAVGIHKGRRDGKRLFTPVSSAFHILDVELLVDG
ncbi:MAG: S1 family peptidase [Acidimicrobiaceae bacterium]|nr:S1 family peptidase [Acidimicrobiaceae bacterium]